MTKKHYLLLVIGVLLICAVTLGFSYAYWMNIKIQDNPNVVESKCFSIEFSEKEGSDINLSGAYPISDEDGMKSTPYEFTITNTCDMYAAYNINMEVLNTTTLSHDLIKAVIDDNTPKVATDYPSANATIDGATSYTLLSGGLVKDESRTYNFRMWVDSSATLENSQNKTIATKIVVVAIASEEPNLIKTLLTQYQDGNEVGLVKDSNNANKYYFKGTNEEVANNFLWYGGHQWRILNFDVEENYLTLITQQPLTSIQPILGAAWNSVLEYENSFINSWLNDYFWNSLDTSVQSNILDTTYNIGIFYDEDEFTVTKKVGLMDWDYYKDFMGEMNSYLNIYDRWWLGNRYNDNVNLVYAYKTGAAYETEVDKSQGVRPLIRIKNINITKGDGSLKNSFRSDYTSSSTDNIQVGEYINLPYLGEDNACGSDNLCTFRVVSNDENGVKVILNGILPQKTMLSSNILDTDNIIYTYLNSFANNLGDNYRIIEAKKFGNGSYEQGDSYKNSYTNFIQANIALPTIGEMFSGNDIDLNDPTDYLGNFVDVDTVENHNVAKDYWMLNTHGSNNHNFSHDSGVIYYDSYDTDERGIRPVLYLKKNLNFVGGEGTAQNPYTLN